MPKPETVPVGIVDLLIRVGLRDEILDQDEQKLARLDWINRLSPGKWQNIAKSLTQEDCESLIQGLVIVERELEWTGGSVSGAIWVFRVYEERFAPSHIKVADWVLKNRGRNEYLPFGSMTPSQNYDEYIAEKQAARERYRDHIDRQSQQQESKERREKERHEKLGARLEVGKERAMKVREFNYQLSRLTVSERFSVIASSDMPLEAVSTDLLAATPREIASVDTDIKSQLLNRIDRRRRGIWSRIKRGLA